MPVAWAEGLEADAEIIHYAYLYAEDGPVIIQKKVNGHWEDWGGDQMTNPIQTKRIEMADKRKGRSCFYFSGSRSGRISWADWFYIREKDA
jgi:hypothetical protein